MHAEKKPGIYMIVCLSNQKVYIGQSKNVHTRIVDHRQKLRKGTHTNPYMQHSFSKHGDGSFQFSALEYCGDSSKESLYLREEFWMNHYDSTNPEKGFNNMKAGISCTHSETTIQKMRELATGRKHSEETRKKISEMQKGSKRNPCPEETKRKISEANKGQKRGPTWNAGKPWSEESREKMRLAKVGTQQSEQHRKNVSDAVKKIWADRKKQSSENSSQISFRFNNSTSVDLD